MLEILVGQLPEAIYFALFMLLTKQLDTNSLTVVPSNDITISSVAIGIDQ